MHRETAFELAASNIRFGAGVTREGGMDLVDLGPRRVLLVADPTLSRMAPVQIARDSIESAGLACVVYDRARVEPSDESFLDAIAFANADPCDAILAVG